MKDKLMDEMEKDFKDFVVGGHGSKPELYEITGLMQDDGYWAHDVR